MSISTSFPPVIVDNLSFCYCPSEPDSHVLDSVTLSVSAGELIILTGASGSGKTTLLTLLGGLKTGANGFLQILGNNIISADTNELLQLRKQVGFIFQSHNLLPYLTALENIRVGLELHEAWRKLGLSAIENRCLELLELLELGARAHFKPRDLSVGQKQRISIARAIANKPKLILADEPTASLDKESARIVITLLRDLTILNQCSVIVVTHDSKIIDYADRIIKLENGVIA
jgi:putative ABC transport system ATP-binding protein